MKQLRPSLLLDIPLQDMQGGNFVSTDLLHRASFRGAARARAEVRLHAEMGLQVCATSLIYVS